MVTKKAVQKRCTAFGTSKKMPKKSILKKPTPKLQLPSDSESNSEMETESDTEIQHEPSPSNNSNKLSKHVKENSNNVKSDDSDSDDLSYNGGDYDDESATDNESEISCGEYGSEQEEEDMDDQENDNSEAEDNLSDDPETAMETAAPSKQQQALANVMGSLLKKNKSVVELLNKPKPTTPNENERRDLVQGQGNQKRKRGENDNVLEIVGEDGTIEKVKVEPKPTKKMRNAAAAAAAVVTKEVVEPGKRHFATNSRTDPYCQDPYRDTDVVKEKKLRSLATQGVVQLFNTLEQFRQQGKDMAAARGNKPNRMAPKHPEVSAITSGGKAGLIDFLMKKGKGGAGPASKTANRPLFSEVKREEGPLESR